jgi:hypothetical protein
MFRDDMKLPLAAARIATLVGLGFAGAGCVKIDGGAVEISWVVRSRSGAGITDCTCADPAIAVVRLNLRLVDAAGMLTNYTPCAGQAQCDFPCQRQTGSTAFDIRATQPGEAYEISVSAVDPDSVPILDAQVMAPAPILRSVISGQPTETEAFQLVADCRAECGGGMNGSGVCARP